MSLIYSKPPNFAPEERQFLLVLDLYPINVEIIRRVFQDFFDSVLSAETVEEAEEILESQNVSHIVISDHFSKIADTKDLIAAWRKTFLSIQRVVLFTGNDEIVEDCPEYDAIIHKPAGPPDLRRGILG